MPKGGPMPNSSVSLVGDPNAVHFGGTISFTYVADLHGNDLPALYVECSQNGVLVYNAGGYPIGSFTLSSPAWETAGGGAASGVATLKSFDPSNPSKSKVLATTSFSVQA